MFYVLHDKITT